MEESSPLRLRLGDDLLSSLLSVWVGVARPRRLLRRLGVEAGDDMLLWYLRHKDKLALSRPNTRLRVIVRAPRLRWASLQQDRALAGNPRRAGRLLPEACLRLKRPKHVQRFSQVSVPLLSVVHKSGATHR